MLERVRSLARFVTLAWAASGAEVVGNPPADYAVVVSSATLAAPDWRAVADALVAKHRARLLDYTSPVASVAPQLAALSPRYVCFVARPEEATREFVAETHRLIRRLDDDPWPDAFWGILTGYDATNALHIARQAAPLTVRKVASGTEVALELCEEGRWYCELNAGHSVSKQKGGVPVAAQGAVDSTEALVRSLNDYIPDLFVTSGHATERDWMIGFRYRSGFFKHAHGQLYGEDTQGRRFPIASPNPKVYLPVGNCLMGHLDRPDCMATAWMNSAGVHQMIGYTVPTWYGYMGWGLLDYFVEQPGRYTLEEAFRANQIALLHRLQSFFSDLVNAPVDEQGNPRVPIRLSEAARAAGLSVGDGRGLLFDRDMVAFYGDPAWIARMAEAPKAWDQRLTRTGDLFHFDITPRRGARTFSPINRNGVQRGGRPIIEFIPERVRDVQLLAGAELNPLIADDFILVPNPGVGAPGQTYKVTFRAQPVGPRFLPAP